MTKRLKTPFERDGVTVKEYKFGGSGELYLLAEHPTTGYTADFGGGDDAIFASDRDDTLTLGYGSDTVFAGAGDDIIYAGGAGGFDKVSRKKGPATNVIYGDQAQARDDLLEEAPGSDTIYGADNANNEIFGDYYQTGDYIIGGVNTGTLTDGGDDFLFGGSGDGAVVVTQNIYGDTQDYIAAIPNGRFNGGDDLIVGGSDTTNKMVGDVENVIGTYTGSATIVGGDDTLVGGARSDDTMIGDFLPGSTSGATMIGGTDTFVIEEDGGQDEILDFGKWGADDILDFKDFGPDFNLDSNNDGLVNGLDDHVVLNGSNLEIDLGAANGGAANVDMLTLMNVAGIDNDDIIYDVLL